MSSWPLAAKLTTKKGEQITVREALQHPAKTDPLDDIDFTKPAYLYGQPVDHELLLLGLSADKYPVAIEKRAREVRKWLQQG